jgi:hypothetical protein
MMQAFSSGGGVAWGMEAGATITGATTIETGGEYLLDAALANADITIATSDPVKLIGNGVGDGSATGANTGIAIIGNANGIDLTLQDAKIFGNVSSKNVINFIGGENTLTIVGTNLIEGQGNGGSRNATVRVAASASLSVEGTGVLYFYKQGQGAGFGSNAGDQNGDMTFSGITLFGKGTQPGPAIGSGSGYDGTPSNITFNSGEYTLIANAMGACIGGGMGGGGGGGGTVPGQGGNVYINGGTFTINVDYAGAAIGGGGYRGGNIAEGGNLIIAGGSLRTVCDENALTQWGSYGITEYGVTDKVITATKLNADGEPVYQFAFDTSLVAAADSFEVEVDGTLIYAGGKHLYKFINEEFDRDTGSALPITTTQSNWVPLTTEDNLYFFLTGTDHELIVNGEAFDVVWDEEGSAFTVEGTPSVPTVDTSWYNTADSSFEIATAAQLAGLAAIVNGTADGIAQDDFTGKTVTQKANIVLEADGLYDSATGRFGASGYPMEATYYTVQKGAKLWTPIGVGTATASNAFSVTDFFAGTYDGAGFSISGLYTDGTLTVQGLFGCVSGTVKNVNVTFGLVAAKIVAGGIAAYLNGGTIENCSNAAIIYADGGQAAGSGLENGVSRGGAIGGIVGNAVGSEAAPFAITGCENTGDIVCTNTNRGGRAAGILGLIDNAAYKGSITNSLNTGDVNAYQYSGGIVGFNYSKVAPISGCVNHGDIQVNSGGSAYGGGIVSQCYSEIRDCYNTGIYTGALFGGDKTAHLGGIVSDLYPPATVTNCYNTGHLALAGTATTSSSVGRIAGSGGGSHSTTAANILNCYYLDIDSNLPEFADAEQGWLSADAAKTVDEMMDAAFVRTLGESYNIDSDAVNGGYPIIDWQGGTAPAELPYDTSWYSTDDSFFELGTADELEGFAAIVNGTAGGIGQDSFAGKTVTLSSDIVLEDVWTPIGTAIPASITYKGQAEISSVADESIPFSGTFDGAGHTISGISVSGATGSEGFFAYISTEGAVKDLTIVGAISDTVAPPGGEHPAGTDYVGGLVAYNRGHLSGITNLVVINAPAVYNVGGIAGFNDGRDNPNAVIENCANLASITGQQRVGGIVGQNAGTIKDSYNAAKVDGTNASSKNGVGGIAGRNGNNNTAVETGIILNCYNTGEVGRSGQKWVGGITGFQNSLSSITNCYVVGTVVRGAGNNNPITGLNESNKNANNYSLFGLNATGGSVGEKGVVKTAEEMQDMAFVKTLGEAYNFDADLVNDGYPVLDWQGGTPPPTVGAPGSGDIDGDDLVTSSDVVALARAIVISLDQLNAAQIAAADMDDDGMLTMVDVVLLMRKAAGL